MKGQIWFQMRIAVITFIGAVDRHVSLLISNEPVFYGLNPIRNLFKTLLEYAVNVCNWKENRIDLCEYTTNKTVHGMQWGYCFTI